MMDTIIAQLIAAGVPSVVATVMVVILGLVFTKRNKNVIGDTNATNKHLAKCTQQLEAANKRLTEQLSVVQEQMDERVSKLEDIVEKKEQEMSSLLSERAELKTTIDNLMSETEELRSIKAQLAVIIKQEK